MVYIFIAILLLLPNLYLFNYIKYQWNKGTLLAVLGSVSLSIISIAFPLIYLIIIRKN